AYLEIKRQLPEGPCACRPIGAPSSRTCSSCFAGREFGAGIDQRRKATRGAGVRYIGCRLEPACAVGVVQSICGGEARTCPLPWRRSGDQRSHSGPCPRWLSRTDGVDPALQDRNVALVGPIIREALNELTRGAHSSGNRLQWPRA